METLKFLGKNYLVDKRQEQHSEVSAVSRVSSSSEVKQCRERSQRFHFNSSEIKTVVNVVRDIVLRVVKEAFHSRSPKTAWNYISYLYTYRKTSDLHLVLDDFVKEESIKELCKKLFENILNYVKSRMHAEKNHHSKTVQIKLLSAASKYSALSFDYHLIFCIAAWQLHLQQKQWWSQIRLKDFFRNLLFGCISKDSYINGPKRGLTQYTVNKRN